MTPHIQIQEKNQIGFYEGYLRTIPEWILTEVFQMMSQEDLPILSSEKIKEVILLKSILLMTHKDFKALCPYLFRFIVTEEEKPLTISIDSSLESFRIVRLWALQGLEELNNV
ncbi:hypothetical protein DIX59_09060 [Streptococcus iniae]|nr:hypothetical protein IUSA1_01250 [Streptococcus iniae IUSA1]KYJ81238.1 hypothetical protein NA30_04365 [Streptococcus iniae]RMI73089.1 hypothetical protein DIX59_09060 [Streptococcus iniae]